MLASKDMVLDNKLKGEEKEVWSNAVEVINEIIDKVITFNWLLK